VFVPEGVREEEIKNILVDNAGEFLVREPRLFDTFVKKFPDGTSKVSYAFRIVFQSQDRTLTGEEIGAVMDKITRLLNEKSGWQVR
jgi:phenylalanyl-tRNA synthetase beta subunit